MLPALAQGLWRNFGDSYSIGHDLAWGNSAFTRTVLVRESEPEFDSTMDQTADESEPEVDSLEPELVGAKKR